MNDQVVAKLEGASQGEVDTTQTVAQTLNAEIRTSPFRSREEIKKIQHDALRATGRTIANIGLAATDVFPAVGWLGQFEKVIHFLGVDVFPDVDKKTSSGCGAIALEVVTLGMAPTYIPDAVRQIWRDKDRIGDGIAATIASFKGEVADFKRNEPEIRKATAEFGVPIIKPPQPPAKLH